MLFHFLSVALTFYLKSGSLIPPVALSFFKIVLAILGPLFFFQTNSVKNAIGNLIRIILNL